MAPTPLQICWMSALVPFWIFHITVIIFLIKKMLEKKKNNYQSIFYKIYVLCSVYDCIVEVNMFFGLRFHLFDFVKPLYLSFSFISSFLYINSAYILYSQCFLHFAIAINRLWAIWMAEKVNSKYSILRIIGGNLIYLIPFLPLPLLAPRFVHEAKYYEGINGELGLRYLDPYIRAYQSSVTILVVTITALLSFICEMVTVFKYHLLMKNGDVMNSKMRQELRLLGQALIILVIQLLMATCQFFVYLSNGLQNPEIMQIALQHFVWIDDLLNLSGPIALFMVSKAVRKDYLIFWSRGRIGKNMLLTSQLSYTSHHPKRSIHANTVTPVKMFSTS